MSRALLVNVVELLRRPGTQRPLHVELLPVDVAADDPRLVEGSDLVVDLQLESLTDGIVVEGSLAADWADECARCLEPVGGRLDLSVRELYQVEVNDPDAFPIGPDQLDLAPMVREALLLGLPDAPLCRADCAGLCPVCGINRNVDSCDCDTSPLDERWAVLDELRDQLAADDG